MIRSLGVAAALAIAAFALLLPGASRAADRTLPMHFDLRLQGPADVCGAQCQTWISASGAITADTPRDFRQFAKGRDLRHVTVVLDSDGGSVLGAIALGREIRRLALSTTVGRLVDVDAKEISKNGTKDETRFGDSGPVRAKLSPRADCESMCAFVLLGGVKRIVPPEARVMVHQIWLGDRREDPTAATYSAEDLVLVQRDIGRLAQYTAEMGASVDLLDLALRIPPWEPMHAMSRDEMRRTGLATDDVTIPSATASATAAPPAPIVQPMPRMTNGSRATPISERRWAMVDRAGIATLARRHPLTVEGEAIGSFDLLLACGADSNSYDLSYVERRHGSEDRPVSAQIASVTLRVGRALVPLKVVASEHHADTGELVSFAAGPVPAGAIGAFAGAGSYSMVIETRSDGLATVIRLGNTGARQDLPRLAAGCGKAVRADLPVRKAGGMAAAQ
jgi:hypothetical protein